MADAWVLMVPTATTGLSSAAPLCVSAIRLHPSCKGRMRPNLARPEGTTVHLHSILGGGALPSPAQAMEKKDSNPSSLLAAAPRVVNIGLELFAVNLVDNGTEVVHVQW